MPSPKDPPPTFSREGKVFEDPERYRRFVEKFLYSIMTQPNINSLYWSS